jgi:NhaP-type Na+/H+ or K+/H+ antiporter
MEGFVFYLGILRPVVLMSALLSRAVERTPLSQTIVFVALGLLLGPPVLGWIHFGLESPVIEGVLLLTLVLVLFADGMKIIPGELRTDWVLPARALGPGILLTVLLMTGAASVLLGMGPLQALLLAFILAPTDTVLISAILEDERIPRKVRQALSRVPIEFTERGISQDAQALADLEALGVMTTPVTVIDSQVVVGFDQPKLERLLGT